AEVAAGEQLGRQDDLRALPRRLLDQRGNGGDVVLLVLGGERELERGDGQLGHAALSNAMRGGHKRRRYLGTSAKSTWTETALVVCPVMNIPPSLPAIACSVRTCMLIGGGGAATGTAPGR